MTTNSLSSLDPALIRPGRVDLFIEYRKATSQQAEELFRIFYTPSQSAFTSPDILETSGEKRENAAPFDLPSHITQLDIERWARSWSAPIQDGTFTIAELQGMLLSWKKDPEGAVEEIPAWITRELQSKQQQQDNEKALQTKDQSEMDETEDKSVNRGKDLNSGKNPQPTNFTSEGMDNQNLVKKAKYSFNSKSDTKEEPKQDGETIKENADAQTGSSPASSSLAGSYAEVSGDKIGSEVVTSSVGCASAEHSLCSYSA